MPKDCDLPIPVADALLMGAHRISATEDAGGVPIITDEGLFEACGVRIAFAGRDGGVSEGPYASMNCAAHVDDDPQRVQRNRAILLDALGVRSARTICPNQVHGTEIACVSGNDSFESACEKAAQGADGAIVQTEGVAALLNFADCLPLIVVAPDGSFAVVHAGWRGAIGHIARAAVERLEQLTAMRASCFNAYIGPHIRSECFEVGHDLEERFSVEFPDAPVAHDRTVSLSAAVASDLASCGVVPQRILDVCICTKCNSGRYFSYRAEGGVCGRNAALAIRIR